MEGEGFAFAFVVTKNVKNLDAICRFDFALIYFRLKLSDGFWQTVATSKARAFTVKNGRFTHELD